MTASGQRLVLIASVLLAIVVSSGVTYLLVRRTAPVIVMTAPAPPPATGPSPNADTCARVAACCRAISSRSPGNSGNCDGFLKLPAVACVQALQGLRQTATMLGATCD
jgi:hypothetical protein